MTLSSTNQLMTTLSVWPLHLSLFHHGLQTLLPSYHNLRWTANFTHMLRGAVCTPPFPGTNSKFPICTRPRAVQSSLCPIHPGSWPGHSQSCLPPLCPATGRFYPYQSLSLVLSLTLLTLLLISPHLLPTFTTTCHAPPLHHSPYPTRQPNNQPLSLTSPRFCNFWPQPLILTSHTLFPNLLIPASLSSWLVTARTPWPALPFTPT